MDTARKHDHLAPDERAAAPVDKAPGAQRRSGPEVHLDEWVAPDVCDERGFLRAGKILEWMDVVGVLAATRYCRRPVVTASVDGMDMRAPIRVGERVTMTAAVGYTSERSIGVSVGMSHGTPSGGVSRLLLTGHMTFVAMDERARVMPVPQFRPESAEEVARAREGQLRREFRNRLRKGDLPALLSTAKTEHEKSLFVRELLKLLPRSLAFPFERDGSGKPRRRHASYVHKIEPIRDGKLNFHGTLYGGTLMRWIETTANVSARAYVDGAPLRLTGLHGLTFIRPVQRHVFVHIRAVVAHTSSDSLTIVVNVHAEDPVAGEEFETLRAFLTYAPDEGGAAVPPLELVGDEERTLFEEIEHRLALQRTLAPS